MHSAVWAQQRVDDTDLAASSAPRIAAIGDCPGADAVAQTIEVLIPRRAIPAPRRGAEVNVADQGDSYKVQVVVEGTTHTRLYRDVGRDCAYRVRVAAVFVVLTLVPPELLMESPPAPPPPPPALPPPLVVAAPPPPPRLFLAPAWRPSLALAGVLDVAPAMLDAPSIVSPGAELRLALHKGRLAGELGFGVQPGAGFSLAGVSVRQRRIPMDASLAFRQPVRGAVELGAAAGVAGAVFEIEGVNPPVRGEGTRVELGARAAVEVRIVTPSRRLAAFIGAHAIYFPRSYELATTPAGVVGHTPSLWVGGQLGASLSF
ncbi:MAG TPA: hypothetical protein VIF57_20590 [Polyangia bacterium]|jgi:hypothetical protein